MIESLKLDLIEYRLRYILTGRKKRKGYLSEFRSEEILTDYLYRIRITKFKINYLKTQQAYEKSI